MEILYENSNNLLFRIMDNEELEYFLLSCWRMAEWNEGDPYYEPPKPNQYKNKQIYYKSFFRHLNDASRGFLHQKNGNIVVFKQNSLGNKLRNIKFTQTDYFYNPNLQNDPKNKDVDFKPFQRTENEDRLISEYEYYTDYDPKDLIECIYIKDLNAIKKHLDNNDEYVYNKKLYFGLPKPPKINKDITNKKYNINEEKENQNRIINFCNKLGIKWKLFDPYLKNINIRIMNDLKNNSHKNIGIKLF